MGDSLLSVVHRAEQTLGRPFIVLADSEYPASRLLTDPHPIKSKFVASIKASAKESGHLSQLPEHLGPLAKAVKPYVFHHPKHRLIAYLEKQPQHLKCIVTNAVYFGGDEDESNSAKPIMSYLQAFFLASNFTPDEMQSHSIGLLLALLLSLPIRFATYRSVPTLI